jgi:hypothetical protein
MAPGPAPKVLARVDRFPDRVPWGTGEFAAELDRVLARRATVVSHSDEAKESDHTPIELIVAVLEQMAGTDADKAYEVAYNILCARPWLRKEGRQEGWKVDHRGLGAP